MIVMEQHLLGNGEWVKKGNKKFERVSRWISIKTNYHPTKRNRLWDYVRDGYGYGPYQEAFNRDDLYLDYFTWNGRTYAAEQFIALGSMWAPTMYYWEENGKLQYLSGVDGEEVFNPIYIEVNEYGTAVRVYKEI